MAAPDQASASFRLQEFNQLSDGNTAARTDDKPTEVAENEEDFPTGGRLAILMVAILFAMFLVALVSYRHRSLRIQNEDKLTMVGSNNHRNRRSDDSKAISRPRRYHVVRQRIPVDQLRHPTVLGKGVHLLFHEDCLPRCNPNLRGRICFVWWCSQFERLHRRTSYCRSRVCGHLHWCHSNHCPDYSFAQASNIRWTDGLDLWSFVYRGSVAGRCVH